MQWQDPFNVEDLFKIDDDTFLLKDFSSKRKLHKYTISQIAEIRKFIVERNVMNDMNKYTQDFIDFIQCAAYTWIEERYTKDLCRLFPHIFHELKYWPHYLKTKDGKQCYVGGSNGGCFGQYGMAKENGAWSLPVIYCGDGKFRMIGRGMGTKVLDKPGLIAANKEDYENQWNR